MMAIDLILLPLDVTKVQHLSFRLQATIPFPVVLTLPLTEWTLSGMMSTYMWPPLRTMGKATCLPKNFVLLQRKGPLPPQWRKARKNLQGRQLVAARVT